jgi:hypothetical protein
VREEGLEVELVDGGPGAEVVDVPGAEVVKGGTGIEVVEVAPGTEVVVAVVGLLATAAPEAREEARTSAGATQATSANRRGRLPPAMPNSLPYRRG